MSEVTAVPQDLTALIAQMAAMQQQMMLQMQAQAAQMKEQADTIARMQAQAVLDKQDALQAARAQAAEAAALAEAHSHRNAWLEFAHVAVALAPVGLAAASIYNGKPMTGTKAAQYVDLGTTLAKALFPQGGR